MGSRPDHETSGGSEQEGGTRVAPECETLLELIGVFAHDISNPLQGLTVLLELALDELSPTAESALKVGQSLEAVERLRHMIRDLSALARTRPDDFAAPDCATAVRRVLGVLQHRLERTLADVVVDLHALEGLPLPAVSIEFATLSVLLGALASLNEAEYPPLVLTIVAAVDEGYGSLQLTIEGREPGEPGNTTGSVDLVLAKHLGRSKAILRRGGGAAIVKADGALEFRWPFDRAPDGDS